MELEILLPHRVFARIADVREVVATTREGAFGLLPRRLDCVAALAPGILMYATATAAPVYLAVDEGVLAKVGAQVRVSVRQVIAGVDLAALHATVKHEFLTLDTQELEVRAAVARMEAGFLRRLAELEHER